MADSPFRKKQVPQATQDEITARLGKKGITWTAQRFPWITVTSMCDVCPSKYVELTSLRGELYESNYLRPLPVINKLDVKKQGELGTTRKATISLTAYSDQQLIELQKCYFIPGMSVRVEWGWSRSALSGKIIHEMGGKTGIELRNYSDTQANSRLRYKTSLEPSTEGLQGIVANFSYSLNRENAWDCTIEVIAAAEAFAGSKVNDHSCPKCVREFESEKEQGKKTTQIEKRSQLYTFFYDLFKSYDDGVGIYKDALQTVADIDSKEVYISQYNYMGVARTEAGGDDSSWYEGGFIGAIINNDPDSTEAYISWATLEAAINLFCIPTSANDNYTLGRLTSTKMPLSYHYNLNSADPRVCLIPGTATHSIIVKNEKSTGPEKNAITVIDGKTRVMLDDILINVVFLMIELKSVESSGDGTLRTFLDNVLNKINAACGGLWQFEVVSTSEDDEDAGNKLSYPTLSVIDAKVYGGKKTDTAYLLPAQAIGEKASILREFKLEVKMTDQMKTQALYSNGKQQQSKLGGGGCSANAFRPFGLAAQGTFRNLASRYASNGPKCTCDTAVANPPAEPTFFEIMTALEKEVSDTTVSAAKSALVEAYAKDATGTKDTHCDGVPMPFEFSFTLDGIGGFGFGQLVTCNRIPDAIRDKFHWQVTTVEHSVTPNDWSTTVNTVCRYIASS